MALKPAEIEGVLGRCEVELAAGNTPELQSIGFWRAVASVKQDPQLVDRFADRIGAIDQATFRSCVPVSVPVWLGTVVMAVGTIVALVIVAATYRLDAPWNGFALIVGTVALMVTLHGPAHLVVGSGVGIRFTMWFVTIGRPQPGLKTDYSTYLRTSPKSRAWMHASGAITTKLVPFLLLPVGPIAGAPWWATAMQLAVGVVAIVTDVAWSTKSSDWNKFRREMRWS